MTIAFERILAWKLLPRVVMAVMLWQYVVVLDWFMSLPQDTVSTQATALTATVTGAISGAFAVWLGHEK
jgi:Tfp pilus assembly protein PilO